MYERPLVSILLPVYRAEATLSACLESVRRQTWEHFECLVIDDGSDDASLDVALSVADRDSRFRVVAAPHRGLVATLNDGLELCHGAYVARMDADDLMHRERLRLQALRLESEPELAGVGCHVRLFPRTGLGEGLRAYERWLRSIDSPESVRAEAFVECPLAHPTWMLRREILVAHGYRDAGWPEDYDLLLRLLATGHVLGVVPRRLHSWRERPDRLTHTHEAYRIERFARLKAAFLKSGLLADRETYVLWGYGHTGRAIRRALLEHGRRPSHIVELHPGRLGQRIHGAPVISPAELADLRGEPIVASVAGEDPRGQIRSALLRMGFAELRDFVCAA